MDFSNKYVLGFALVLWALLWIRGAVKRLEGAALSVAYFAYILTL